MGQEINTSTNAEEKGNIILSGQTVSYNIRRSPKAKYIRLEVRLETGLTVIIPNSYSSREISPLIKNKEHWILEKLEKYNNALIPRYHSSIIDGNEVLFLGQSFEVVTVQSSKNSVSMNMGPNRLLVAMKADSRGLSAVLEGWYRKQAANLIEEKAKKFCASMGVAYSRISIRGQKARWGSCSKQGNLNFNWKLIMAPEPVVDYVIIHELSHLIEMNHSKRFWQIVEIYCPQWQEYRKWLNEHII